MATERTAFQRSDADASAAGGVCYGRTPPRIGPAGGRAVGVAGHVTDAE